MTFAVQSLSKSYGGVPVLSGVDLTVADGEIHALLGANGAGKSTLIKAVCGAIRPDSGTIVLGSQQYVAPTPRSARTAGVSVIHQDPAVVTSLSVSDNVFLGRELRRGGLIRRRAQVAETKTWLRRLGFDIDPNARLSDLSNADLQLVEITRALRTEPNLLILDEPTAALTEAETARLLDHLVHLKSLGLPILYVTHRLSEVFAVADRVTVLAGGRVRLAGDVAAVRQRDIVEAIAGRQTSTERATSRSAGPVVLDVRDLTAVGIGPIDLTAQTGEVVGIYGLLGSGRTELLECLSGARPIARGSVRVDDRPVACTSPVRAVRAGIALVPSDRLRKSVLLGLSAADNVCLPSMAPLSRFGLRRRRKERALFDSVGATMSLHPRRPKLEARGFSGGNQQKLVVGRWLRGTRRCRVLLLDEPTQGVDIGARAELYAALREASADRAVVVTSSEPEELVQVADRVIVIGHGRRLAELRGDDVTEERLLALAHLDEVDHDGPAADGHGAAGPPGSPDPAVPVTPPLLEHPTT